MTYVGSGRPSALQVIFTLFVIMGISGTLFKVVILGLTKKEKTNQHIHVCTRIFQKTFSNNIHEKFKKTHESAMLVNFYYTIMSLLV